MQRSDVQHYLASRLWFWPLIGLVGALTLAVATLTADAYVEPITLSVLTSDPETALAILSVIAAAMVSLIVFAFTITMVVVQLASSQYSPRLMGSVLGDRPTKATLTLFLATFAYALLVLRAVVDEPEQVFIPELSLLITYVLVLASLFAFIMYINHVAQSVRVSHVIERVAEEIYALVDRCGRRAEALRGVGTSPDATRLPGDALWVIEASGDERGVLKYVDEDALIRLARRDDLLIEVVPRVGDYVPSGSVVLRVYGEAAKGDGPDADALLRELSFGTGRTLQQDIGFGIRQLVDIANRALSSGINDPTTALQCIDRLHEVLRRLAVAPDLPSALADEDGRVRLIVPRMGWADYLALAVTEVRLSGAASPQIPRRLEAMLRDLRSVASPLRAVAVERELRLLEATVERAVELPEDRAFLEQPDVQGLGAGPAHH